MKNESPPGSVEARGSKKVGGGVACERGGEKREEEEGKGRETTVEKVGQEDDGGTRKERGVIPLEVCGPGKIQNRTGSR